MPWVPSVQLRPLTAEEYLAFRARSVPAYAADLERARGMTSAAARQESETTFPAMLSDAMDAERTWLFRVLTAEGVACGWLWLGPHPHRADGLFIYDIEIEGSHQRQGLGRATMLAAEDLARNAGLTHIALNVFGWNTGAETLYRSLGYTTESTHLGKSLGGQH